ncbi:MAG: hypothetical protein ACE366_17720 [Bradymonadia bacterium]
MRIAFTLITVAAASLMSLPHVMACSGPGRSFVYAVPDTGSLPANSPIVLHGYTTLEDVEATVDGVPAVVIELESIPGMPEIEQISPTSGFANKDMFIRLEPEPPVGSSVHLRVDPCGDGSPEAESCVSTFEYEIVEADESAPGEVQNFVFDAYDYARSWWGDSCGGEADHTTHFEGSPSTHQEGGAQEYVVLSRKEGDGPWVVKRLLWVGMGGINWNLPSDDEEALVDGVCWKAEQIDLAGNRSDVPSVQCAPCRVLQEDAGARYVNWSGVEPFPRGSCAGQTLDEGQDVSTAPIKAESSGCALSAGHSGGPLWVFWVMMGGCLVRRRADGGPH